MIRQVFEVLRKELLLEFRKPARITGVFFFGFAIVLMFGFASSSDRALREMAGGILWLGLLLASTRAFDQSYTVEMEHGAFEGLVLWPVNPMALYYGKALGNTSILVVVALALSPLVIGMTNATVEGNLWMLAGYVVLGCAALAAPGTLLGLVTSQTRGSSVLLPLMLFPLVMPAILAAAKGTITVMEGDLMGSGNTWLRTLIAVNVIHWGLSGLLYQRIAEDG